ncbi:hypothetical protein Cni_G25629 [Canna indica]|uniref:Uncharacterized protein n=1 Tax=Canna indica TaxID=4628 RepID=A0AAQ3L268_9LILI|nr:hypothetical protein Cni_G25629 [Canna indica]
MAFAIPSSITSAPITAAFAPLHPRCFVNRLATAARLIPLATSRPSRLRLRLGNAANFYLNHRLPIVFASDSSNAEPSDKGKAESSSEASGGPPVATILAGVLVFLLFCWFVGFIVMWLVGLILNPPTS